MAGATRHSPKRLILPHKEAQRLGASKITIFDLPGEIRNAIYSLAFDKQFQRVPLNPEYRNKSDPHSALLRTCSRMYEEVRSYLVEKQVAYIPVLTGMTRTYGEPTIRYGIPRATKDTMICALTDFMNVHFHLHLDLLLQENYNPDALIMSLTRAIKIYQARSETLYFKHNLGPRRATVHLDHLLSLWTKIHRHHMYLPIGTIQRLVYLIGKDTMTEWSIRYYIATGQLDQPSSYGVCMEPNAIRDTELAQLKYHASQYRNINVVAEIYGHNTTWEFGDKTRCVTRMRTPPTEFWPNLHYDASKYKVVAYDSFKGNYPEHMPVECFDTAALDATHRDRNKRARWMESLDWRDLEADMEGEDRMLRRKHRSGKGPRRLLRVSKDLEGLRYKEKGELGFE